MKEIPGDQLVIIAAAAAVELAKNIDGEEAVTLSDFFDTLSSNLALIGGRRLFREELSHKKSGDTD